MSPDFGEIQKEAKFQLPSVLWAWETEAEVIDWLDGRIEKNL